MPQSKMAGCNTSDLDHPPAIGIVKFLSLYEWLLDIRIVDFFTEHHWEKLPRCWQHSLSRCDLKELCLQLLSPAGQHVPTATVWPLSLLAYTVCCQVFSVQRRFSTSPSSARYATVANSNRPLPHSKHIKPKKQHEIKHLSEVIHKLSNQQKCYNIIDIGSGHGHLARHLVFHHQLNVTTVECDDSHHEVAVKFDREVEQDLEKKARGVDVKLTGVLNHITNHIRPNIDDKEVTELVQECVDEGGKSVGGAGINEHVILVGLHTCGDLSPTMLRMFATCPRIIGLVSVGCCYMKLTCANEPHPPAPIGYPISSKIKLLDGHSLSYESRELACHALEIYRSRVLNDSEHLKIHCYRAVVQTILKQHNLHRSQLVVAKKTSKLPFEDYAREILASFHLPIATELDMNTLRPLLDRWKDVVVLYMLRLAIAPCIESIILLDRLYYLQEHGYNATMVPLFDPSISPRNLVIIADKLNK